MAPVRTRVGWRAGFITGGHRSQRYVTHPNAEYRSRYRGGTELQSIACHAEAGALRAIPARYARSSLASLASGTLVLRHKRSNPLCRASNRPESGIGTLWNNFAAGGHVSPATACEPSPALATRLTCSQLEPQAHPRTRDRRLRLRAERSTARCLGFPDGTSAVRAKPDLADQPGVDDSRVTRLHCIR